MSSSGRGRDDDDDYEREYLLKALFIHIMYVKMHYTFFVNYLTIDPHGRDTSFFKFLV